MRISWIGLMFVAGVMAGCGSGSGAGSNGAGQSASGPKTYVAAKPTAGDYYTWENVTREQGSTVDYYNYSTKVFRSVAADGAASVNYLGDIISMTAPQTYTSNTTAVQFDALGRWTGASAPGCTRTPSPPFNLVAPPALAVGVSWQYSGVVQTKCELQSSTQVSIDFKDSVVAMEAVTVGAGTFNTLKVTRSETAEDGSFRTVSERTCWWEPDLGIGVKCVTNSTVTNKGTGENRVKVDTETLVGYSNQRLARKADTTGRFMGNWKGRYDGMALGQNTTGSCTLAIDWNGNITGSCTGAAVAFNIVGQVGADGTLNFLATSNGSASLTFTSKLDSLQQMSGGWNMPDYGSGTWTITQD